MRVSPRRPLAITPVRIATAHGPMGYSLHILRQYLGAATHGCVLLGVLRTAYHRISTAGLFEHRTGERVPPDI